MAEYISREAALSEACHGCSIDFSCEPCEPQDCEIKARLEAIPAADVVEVVRCRDCVLARKPDRRKPAENRACEGTLICCVGFDHVYPDADDGLIFVDEYFYCSEGKRKDGGPDDV